MSYPEKYDLRTPEETAAHMIAKYGYHEAANWAAHYKYNNHDAGDFGYAYWSEVLVELKRMEKEKRSLK
jgi:hypothetical protein